MQAEDAIITVSTTGEPNCGSFWGSTTIDYRLYQAKKGDLTFTAKEGYKISSVKVTYNVNNNGTLVLGDNNITSNTVVQVNDSSITFVVGNTGTGTSGQVRVTAIEVIYYAI